MLKYLNGGIASALLVALCACGGNGSLSVQPLLPGLSGSLDTGAGVDVKASKRIKHVIIVIQENRSFNNLFAGYPGATTSLFGYNTKKKKIALQPVPLETTWDLQHTAKGFLVSCNGTGKIPGTNCRMNGFDLQTWTCDKAGQPRCPNENPPYSYVPHSEIKPYFNMARQYVLADHMFASDFDTSSFISHQYMIAGVNPNSSANYPDTAWGCPGGSTDRIDKLGNGRKISHVPKLIPCWDPPTLADELDQKGLSWSFYAQPVKADGGEACGTGLTPDASKGRSGIWSAYQAIKHICHGPDWNQHVFSPSSQFFTDIGNGNLSAVTWITPTYANSDHGGSGSKTGPSWVTAIVNAVGKSAFWDTSAIFVLWDDSGGWYDPIAPPYVDNDGFGFRLPLLIVSPYARQGRVSHVVYEHGSILKFTEDVFGLGRLSASDTRAKTPAIDCFDFNQKPRPFTPIKADYDQSYFMAQPLDTRPPDNE
ncbi:MAG: hypothetical protein JO351_02320 [Candidatus Eremiobacteraeota bacterium]|nr:hypothetical protein [Candidatus Eremiobacteraeota bacterium]